MTLPEWGLWQREDGHGGGDNPFFIEKMHAFITDPANNIAYQGYFDVDTDDGAVRVSFVHYTTRDEVDRLLLELDRCLN